MPASGRTLPPRKENRNRRRPPPPQAFSFAAWCFRQGSGYYRHMARRAFLPTIPPPAGPPPVPSTRSQPPPPSVRPSVPPPSVRQSVPPPSVRQSAPPPSMRDGGGDRMSSPRARTPCRCTRSRSSSIALRRRMNRSSSSRGPSRCSRAVRGSILRSPCASSARIARPVASTRHGARGVAPELALLVESPRYGAPRDRAGHPLHDRRACRPRRGRAPPGLARAHRRAARRRAS